MSSKGKIGLFAIVLIILVALLWIFNREQGYNWYDELRSAEDGQPYALDFFDDYIHTQFSNNSFHYSDSTLSVDLPKYNSPEKKYNFLFLGFRNYLDEESKEAVMQFVEKGNNAFFMQNHLPSNLISDLIQEEPCVYYYYGTSDHVDSVVYADFIERDLQFTHPVKYAYMQKEGLENKAWRYMEDAVFCPEKVNFEKLGYFNEEQVNFFRVKYGRGYFYFHTNPEFFTNYYLINEPNQKYVEKAMSYADGSDMIWDRNTRFENFDNDRGGSNLSQRDSPLQYILSRKRLRWGFYTLMGALFLYFVIGLKRKQRSIDIITPKENTSIEYVETISELFFQRKGNDKIYNYMTEQFFAFVRKRYHLSTKKIDEDFIASLMRKSKIPKDKIDWIINMQIQEKKGEEISESFLIRYHKLIQYFYNNCK